MDSVQSFAGLGVMQLGRICEVKVHHVTEVLILQCSAHGQRVVVVILQRDLEHLLFVAGSSELVTDLSEEKHRELAQVIARTVCEVGVPDGQCKKSS